jgi:hypothetical protein
LFAHKWLGCSAALSRNLEMIIFYFEVASGYFMYDFWLLRHRLWAGETGAPCTCRKCPSETRAFFLLKYRVGGCCRRVGWLLHDLRKDTYGNDWILRNRC